MSAFQTANPLWDFHMPPDSLTTLPDDDFLAILQSQMANPSQTVDPSAFYVPQQDIPLSANPKSLTRVPEPTTNSPLTDSSPSPPSGQETPATDQARPSAARRRSTITDDALKRKTTHPNDDDDDELGEGPPFHRSHGQDRNLAKNSKRKSAGSAAADEQRLLKRKEQNRAAQRAFRERKEKHVKDLEDQLAVSEAKNEATQSENENLKEMLRRLQTENTLLKQAAFTFSVPRSIPSSEKANGKSDADVQQQQFLSGGRKDAPSGSSSQASPNSLFEDTFNEMPGYSAPSSVATDSPKNFTMAERSLSNSVDPSKPSNVNSGYGQKQDWMSVPSPPANGYPMQSPFTIISSNPTYMSYRDPSPTGSFSPFSTLSTPSNTGPSYSPFIQQQQQQAQQNFLSPDFTMTDLTMNSSPADFAGFSFAPMTSDTEQSNLDDLFGGQFNVVQPFSPFSVGTSPVSHPGSSGKPSPASQQTSNVDHAACGSMKDPSQPCGSRDDVAKFIAAQGPSTFVTDSTRVVFENGHIRFDGKPLPLPPIEKQDTNVDAALAYKSLQSHPKIKDVDEHELCAEFASKARCDGARAVIPSNDMHDLLQRISGHERGMQQDKQ